MTNFKKIPFILGKFPDFMKSNTAMTQNVVATQKRQNSEIFS